MRFLIKPETSAATTMKYKPKGDNRALLSALRAEQKQFCAYTERRFRSDDSVDVEHFDPKLKGTKEDGTSNWYAVLHRANQRKRRQEKKFETHALMKSRFFQSTAELWERIEYVSGEWIYAEREESDSIARALLEYLSINDIEHVEDRRRHVLRLAAIFEDAGYDDARKRAYFERHPEELDFITVLVAELGVELFDLV